jgi:CRP-like cAMP-binding protein
LSLEKDVDLLAQVGLFSDLAEDQLRLLAFSAVRHELIAGRELFRRGEPARSGFVVSRGVITVSVDDALPPINERCEAGCLIGERALFVDSKRRVTATATEDSEALEITRPSMTRMLNEYPSIAVAFHRRLAARLGATIGELERVKHALLAIGA